MNIKFLKSKERKKLLEELAEKFGIEELPNLLIETGKEKIRGFSGTMNKEEILELAEISNVEIIGLYLIKKEKIGLRLSLDALHILNVKKNIIEINKEQAGSWMKGNDLEILKRKGIYIIKFENDFLGSGISNENKIINFVPKERRIRN